MTPTDVDGAVTLDQLAQLLTAAVGVPVLLPGETTAEPPYVVLAPVRWELAAGNLYAQRVVDVTVAVPLTQYREQHARLELLTFRTLAAVMGTNVSVDDQVPFTIDPDQQLQLATITLAAPAVALCRQAPPPPPLDVLDQLAADGWLADDPDPDPTDTEDTTP